MKRYWIIVGIAFVMLCTSALAMTEEPRPWTDIRFLHVVRQSTWWSCGAAAVATLLEHYYEIPTQELDILNEVLDMEQRGTELGGLSLATLRQLIVSRGINVRAYQVSLTSLVDYFDQGGLPLILHFTQPRPHFVLAVAIVGRMLAIADPSFGERLLNLAELPQQKGFTGYVLVPIPNPTQMRVVSRNQSFAKLRFAKQSQRLEALRRNLY